MARNGKGAEYVTRIEQLSGLSRGEVEELSRVSGLYAFRANTYYLGLIDWDDPDDPLRRIVIPSPEELDGDWGSLDASDEACFTRTQGLEHKYEFTALLLVSDLCGGFCRFCFRKRLFLEKGREIAHDVDPGLAYIRRHPQINNVLLTGGDPLLLPTERLDAILAELRKMGHVKIIRIGSKIPAFNPRRIIDDPALVAALSRHSESRRRLYVMTQFNHPRELTDEAVEALSILQEAGVVTANQTPLLQGVNDDPAVLGDLFNQLSYVGVPPYYLFIGRPTIGNRHFSVPVERSLEIFEEARRHCSGLAKRARLVMSHRSGKIEVLGMTGDQIFFRYHRAADPAQKGRFMAFPRNPDAYWFDDYEEAAGDGRAKAAETACVSQ